jgi:hypothetical protein
VTATEPMAPDVALPGWRGLEPEQRWAWWQQLYEHATHLTARYRLGLRTGWWEDNMQTELLAALAAWVGMFDYGNWTDPEAKARLLSQLEDARRVFRGGAQTFEAGRDRSVFEKHLRHLGCRPGDDRPRASGAPRPDERV